MHGHHGGTRRSGGPRSARGLLSAVVAMATFGASLGLISVFASPAVAEDEPFDGLVDVPGVGSQGDVVPVDELPALPSEPPPERELDVPEGDFSNPPRAPHAPADQVAAYQDAVPAGGQVGSEGVVQLAPATAGRQPEAYAFNGEEVARDASRHLARRR